ncbi:MAG: hypothetical protein IK123_01420, partial [Lachnospiraceae bacterium]|nr:hypothetical protein [Lachnospiraceae bacterium]
IAVLVTKLIGNIGSGSDKGAAGEGTALAQMLDKAGDEVADIYSIDLSKLDEKAEEQVEDEGIIWDDEEEEDENESEAWDEPEADASSEGHEVVDVDTAALAKKYTGDTEEKENDKFSVQVPDSWMGSVSGESDTTRSGSFGELDSHKGKMTFIVDYTDTFTQDDVDDKLAYLRDHYGATDISVIDLPDTVLYGVEYDDEHLGGDKFAKRQYYGIHNNELVNIFIDSQDTSTDIFNDPSLWALIYSLKLK